MIKWPAYIENYETRLKRYFRTIRKLVSDLNAIYFVSTIKEFVLIFTQVISIKNVHIYNIIIIIFKWQRC